MNYCLTQDASSSTLDVDVTMSLAQRSVQAAQSCKHKPANHTPTTSELAKPPHHIQIPSPKHLNVPAYTPQFPTS